MARTLVAATTRMNRMIGNYALPLYLLAVAWIAITVASRDWAAAWRIFGVGPMSAPFADMRTVQGALLSASLGMDPQVENPGDPWQRAMNYPALWIDIARQLRLADEANFLAFCFVMIAVFIAANADLLRRFPSVPLLAATLSWAVLLGVERGNNDMLIFSLVYVAALAAAGWGLWLPLVLATMLKIYPLCAIVALAVRFTRVVWLPAVVLAIAAGANSALEMLAVRAATPTSAYQSYGVPSMLAMIEADSSAMAWLGASTWLVLTAAALAARFTHDAEMLATTLRSGVAYNLFLFGASVYCGTFLLSSNSDYRLMFLSLCIPYAHQQAAVGWKWLAVLVALAMNVWWLHRLAATSAASTIGPDWLFAYSPLMLVVDHGIKVAVFLICCCVLMRHLHDAKSAVVRSEAAKR